MGISNKDLLRLQSRLGVLGFADAVGRPQDVVSGLKEAIEKAGGGVTVTQSEATEMLVFSRQPLTEADFRLWEESWLDSSGDDGGRMVIRNKYVLRQI